MSQLPTPIRYLSEITEHITKYFGTDFFVLDERKSSIVHVDVHVVRPTPARPYFTLLTSGMSDLDMHMPKGFESLALAELCLCLPSNWPLGMSDFGWRQPGYFWPIAVLMETVRYTHRQKTWLSWGHTLGGIENMLPFNAGVEFTGIMFLNPQTFPEGADSVQTEDDRTIHYLSVVPLLSTEMNFKEDRGWEALEENLLEAGVTEVIDPHRPSCV